MAVVRSHHVDLKSPSMKVPPKRKGNAQCVVTHHEQRGALNESPSEKEGKSLPKLGAVRVKNPQ